MDRVIERDHDIDRGRRLDRELAADLGRAQPPRAPGAAHYAQELERRPGLAPEVEQRLAARAKRGDAAARARLVGAVLPPVSPTPRGYRGARGPPGELRQGGGRGPP